MPGQDEPPPDDDEDGALDEQTRRALDDYFKRLKRGRLDVETLFDETRSEPDILTEAVTHHERTYGMGLSPSRFSLALEAIIRTNDRPAIRIVEDALEWPEKPMEHGAWLYAHGHQLLEASLSVGRIDLGSEHVGTGFVVGDGVILTNRHVAEVVAKQFRVGPADRWIMKAGRPTIDFLAGTGPGRRARFAITGVLAVGPDPIEKQVDFRKLDAALLTVDASTGSGADGSAASFPKALRLTRHAAIEEQPRVVVLGYPGHSTFAPSEPRRPTQEELDVLKAVSREFAGAYGVKRASPGEITRAAVADDDDPNAWVFDHDATTLGGSSGSPVLAMEDGEFAVIGLHFGGATRLANHAHVLGALKPFLEEAGVSI